MIANTAAATMQPQLRSGRYDIRLLSDLLPRAMSGRGRTPGCANISNGSKSNLGMPRCVDSDRS